MLVYLSLGFTRMIGLVKLGLVPSVGSVGGDTEGSGDAEGIG
tara:strand:- start:62 stop:187 length:126 start_codon:yes stop_codon:yes gene_type:complete